MKKRVAVITLILISILIMGCLDYKSYNAPEGEDSEEELSLIDEIAQIERELGLDTSPEEEEVEALEKEIMEEEKKAEEIILPDLEEEPILSEELEIITVKENELVKLNVKITDPDEDLITHSFSKPLNSKGEWKTNYGDAGEYIITITATDGQLTTEKEIKVVVERVNVPPEIASLRDLTVKEGEIVEFEPRVTDPNKDPVTVSVSEPLKSGSFQTDHTSSGEYQIIVTATDGELASEANFKLTVKDVNVLPEITNVENTITIKEGETVTIKPVITDLDNDEITLTIGEPVGDDGVWETKFTDHGEYFISIAADDGKDKVAKRVRIVVEDVNMPPEIVEVSLINN